MNAGGLVGRSLNLLAGVGVDREEVGVDREEVGDDREEVGVDRENTEGPIAGYVDSMGR